MGGKMSLLSRLRRLEAAIKPQEPDVLYLHIQRSESELEHWKASGEKMVFINDLSPEREEMRLTYSELAALEIPIKILTNVSIADL
jgi:hypothetical protein